MNSNGTDSKVEITIDDAAFTALTEIDNDNVLSALASIRDGDNRREEVERLAERIGEMDKVYHGRVLDAIMKADPTFTKTEADQFIKACIAMVKRLRKERAEAEKLERKEQEKAEVIAARTERTIIVGDRQLHEVTADAMAALAGLVHMSPRRPRVYVKLGVLSRMTCDENGNHKLQEMPAGALPQILSEAADWIMPVETEKGYKEVSVFPPKDVAIAVFNMGSWPGVPSMSAIVNAPVFGRNGELHSEPGYDAGTGLYYTGGVNLGDTTPTAERIAWAKNMLLVEVFGDFPFSDDASRAHTLVYTINPFVREMINGPVAPTAFDAPTRGTGKSLLMNLAARIFLGGDLPVMTDTLDDDEWRKRLVSKLMTGATHMAIDNIKREIDSGVLCSAWTEPVLNERLLGMNIEVSIPNRMIWALTANNIQFSDEAARRVVWVRQDANLERPELRDPNNYRHPRIKEWVAENRDELVTAVIVLVRAWIEAGKPLYRGRAKGSYESWAGIMGGILQVIGVPGFLENDNELFKQSVTESDEMGDFVVEWWKCHGDKEIGLSQSLFKLASVSDTDSENETGQYKNLLSAKLTSNKQRGRAQQLGRLLDAAKGRVYQDFKIVYTRILRGEKMYKLEDHRQDAEKVSGNAVPTIVEQIL